MTARIHIADDLSKSKPALNEAVKLLFARRPAQVSGACLPGPSVIRGKADAPGQRVGGAGGCKGRGLPR